MPHGLRRWVADRVFSPWLDWAQVEVTTDCNARCTYCPTAVRPDWRRRHMALADFRRILPMLARSTRPSAWRQPLLHLQGWGEPLLNPDLLGMVAAAKAAGLKVGTTSNGMLIDEAMAGRLVRSGIDVLSLSVAGIDGRNDAIRRGTRLDRVFAAIAAIERHKKALGSATPAVHIAYMLLASGLEAVERIPETFAGRGVAEIVVATLSHVAEPSLAAEVIAPGTEAELAALDGRLARAAERAAALGVRLAWRIPRPPGGRPGLCAENVQAAVIVTVDGKVAPCMFGRFGEAPLAFGDLAERSLTEVWCDPAYLAFRRTFWDGNPPARCVACAKLGRT